MAHGACARGRPADRADALGPDRRSRRRRCPFSRACAPSPRRAMPARRPAWARMSISSPARWRTSISTTPTARCCSCRSRASLRFCTEFGIIDIEPGEIAVIPRGVKFRVELTDGPARGYVCENYGGAFTLPERGPIGANCLANPRDFLTPGRRLRGHGRALADVRQMGRRALGRRRSTIRRSTSSPGTATTRPTNTTCAASRRSARSSSIMPTRRSSRC